MEEVFLGWDVGAWHCELGDSRDALCALIRDTHGEPVLAGRPWRGNLRKTLNDHEGPELVDAMLGLLKLQPLAKGSVTVAIDTPLGWPAAFLDLLLHRRLPNSIPEIQHKNNILFRRTDQILVENGHRPLSVVQDLISSASTKGMFFLERARLTQTQLGIWTGDEKPRRLRVTAIETYPAPCKKGQMFDAAVAEIAKAEDFRKVCDRKRHVEADVKDALYCALVAFELVHRREGLLSPDSAGHPVSAEEGWIWIPRECYPKIAGSRPSQ
jgi:hypothetical protein